MVGILKYLIYAAVSIPTTTTGSWQNARRVCRGYGWRLPTFHNPDQLAQLGSLHKTVFGTTGTAHQYPVWIGLNDIYRAASYQTKREIRAWEWEGMPLVDWDHAADGTVYNHPAAFVGGEGADIAQQCVELQV